MTEKLFYIDSHIKEFSAVVTDCKKYDNGYIIELDRTAFFPEGGGQSADTGMIGEARVSYTYEKDKRIWHVTDIALDINTTVDCAIDWEKRFRNMQNHTGEHIISGIVHNRYGYDNVGFHMGEDGVIVDFDGFVSDEELRSIEFEANRIVTENRPITTSFPPAEKLHELTYRSKLDLVDNVRLVTIEGIDVCACCAPHVKFTGEIGCIKIFESIRRKNGVRLRMLSGIDAYEDYCKKALEAARVSSLLSAKQNEISDAVEHLIAEKDLIAYRTGGLVREYIKLLAESVTPTEKNVLFFEPLLDTDALRMLVNSVISKCGGYCAAFSGDDENGYKYVIANEYVDMKASAKNINAALNGRGGGKNNMISGSVLAKRDEIEEYFSKGNGDLS